MAVFVVLLFVAVPLGATALTPDAVPAGRDGDGAGDDRPRVHADAKPAVVDPTRFDASALASLADGSHTTFHLTWPAGADSYTARLGTDGLLRVDGGAGSILAEAGNGVGVATPGPDLALCTPTRSGVHYTTHLDQQDTCPFTWHDGPIHETVLTCAVGGDCTIAGQDAPTGGTFWIICFGRSASTEVWGVLPAVEVQCDSGSIGPAPHTWTRWTSWCRVFGVTPGAATCGHLYG